MSTITQTEPDPLSARKLAGLFLLAIALIILPSLITDKRISLKPVDVSLELHAIEESVEAVSLKEVTPNTDIAEPVPEAPQAPVQPEVVQTPPPAPEPKPEPVVPYTPVSGSKADWMAQAGIAQSDWGYVEKIIGEENHLWCPTRWNGQKGCPGVVTETNPDPRASSAYGICQALPGRKMASAGSDWQTNVVTQLRWCHSYAQARYGSWSNAWTEWQRKGWW